MYLAWIFGIHFTLSEHDNPIFRNPAKTMVIKNKNAESQLLMLRTKTCIRFEYVSLHKIVYM